MVEKPTYEELEQRVRDLESALESCKQNEKTLQLIKNQIQFISDNSPAYMAYVGADDLRYKFINHQFEISFNLPRDEIVGKHIKEIIGESNYEFALKYIEEVRSGKSTFYENIFNLEQGNRWIRVNYVPDFDEQRRVKGIVVLSYDITDRKRAEEALRGSEERFRLAFENANDGVCLVDTDGNLVRVNNRMCDIFGYSKKELESMTVNDIAHPEDKDISPRFIKKSISGEVESAVFEKRYFHKQGHIIWGQVSSSIIKDAKGDPLNFISHVQDISQRKRTEEVLRQSKTFLQDIFDAIQDGISLLDRDLTIIQVNKWIEEAHHEDMPVVGKKCYEVYQKRLTPCPWCPSVKCFSTGKIQVEEMKVPLSGDSFFWIELSAYPLKDENGVITGVIEHVKDITKRKQAEKALREAYDIINRSPAVVFLWQNAEGWPVEFVSDNVKKLFGYTTEEFASGKTPYATTVHPDDLERVAQEITTYSGEEGRKYFVHKPYRIVTKDGETKWLDDMTFIRRDEKGDITHYEGIVLDISERVKAEEEKENLQEKLQRSQKMESMGLLAGGVAHDLNNVLSGIVSYPELLLLDLPEDSKLRKPIETIQESGHRAVAIVQDLLTVARGVATTKEPLNLNDLVGDYLNSPEFKKLKQFHLTVTVKTNLDSDLLNVSGSHVHIRKVVMNLVSNASKAIEGSGNVTISTMNRYVDRPIRGYDDVNIGEYAVLAVSDDGSGISSDDLERIFEPFYTKKVTGRNGTGLGLAVVWNVVQDHKGYIDVKNDENGTTFELYFPITREEISDKDLSIHIKDFKGDGETILVVDDVESQRDISCSMLDTLGYKTKAVSSGEEAVEYLKENTVDLLLLDMIMDPGINGRETYERVIKIHPNQKAIIISGFAETDEVKETQKLGAGKYIKKPVTLEKIGLAIKEELEK